MLAEPSIYERGFRVGRVDTAEAERAKYLQEPASEGRRPRALSKERDHCRSRILAGPRERSEKGHCRSRILAKPREGSLPEQDLGRAKREVREGSLPEQDLGGAKGGVREGALQREILAEPREGRGQKAPWVARH